MAGRYELAEVIGRGGMGTVYRAVDLVLGRSVAVKTLPWLIADQNPNSVARFEREARAAAALSHPAVVAVYDTGVDASTHFIVMELAAGRSLEAILRQEGALDPERAVGIAAGVADALAAAHRAGIVHRDIKPANVMVADDGSVKVLDFGIARSRGAATLTENAAVLGTAAYMAPEQAMGQPADERSDIYALGCVLYAMLSGHPPFAGDGFAAIMHQQANADPRPLRSENPRVPSALSGLVMQMLAKAPGDRPQSAGEVRNRLAAVSHGALAGVADTEPTARMRAGGVGPAVVGAAGSGGLGGTGGSGASGRRGGAAAAVPAQLLADERPARRRIAAAGAIAAVVLVIALVALASGSGSPRRTAATGKSRTASATASTATRARARAKAPTHAPRATAPAAASTPDPATTSASTATVSDTAPPHSVSEAAGALSSLITRDLQSGAITPKAAHEIGTALVGVIASWQHGDAAGAQQQLAAVTQQLAALAQHGEISAAAAPALTSAVADLRNALASTSPPQTAPPDPAKGGHPPGHGADPGHGGPPPGHAKKHDGGLKGGD
ncbi:MAG TPA: protein kinase [Solirubrobacteraceae bacterium]|nr:protein kinase [Solirubrobacteraceae bacterium]